MTKSRWAFGAVGAALVAGSAGLAGCAGAGDKARPLSPGAFLSRQPVVEARSTPQPVDRSGALLYDRVHIDGPPPDESTGEPVSEISDTVRESVKPPNRAVERDVANGERPPTTRPVAVRSEREPEPPDPPADDASAQDHEGTAAAEDPSGQFQILGTVLAKVDDEPVYADEVIEALESALSAEAKRLDERAFRAVAADLIQRQVDEFIRADLEFAAAQRSLEGRDKMLADVLTAEWRNRQITEAGGSLELARRKAADEGGDFEDLVQQQYRLQMTRIYYQKRVVPRIQVSAEEMRRYYERNRNTEFTQHGEARFQVVAVDPRQLTGGREEAFPKIDKIRRQLASGDSPQQIVDPKDQSVTVSGGERSIVRGAYRLEEVEKAVWEVQPGEVTDVVEEGGVLYVAKLLEAKRGTEKAFEDPAVQDHIREKLRAQQFDLLRNQVQVDLQKGAIITLNKEMLPVALEMAMQRYPRWAAR